jgi:hypothetical protein
MIAFVHDAILKCDDGETIYEAFNNANGRRDEEAELLERTKN